MIQVQTEAQCLSVENVAKVRKSLALPPRDDPVMRFTAFLLWLPFTGGGLIDPKLLSATGGCSLR